MATKDFWSTYNPQFDSMAAELGDDEKAQIIDMLDSLAPRDIFSNPVLKNNWAKWYGMGLVEQFWENQTGMLSLYGIGFAKYLKENAKSAKSLPDSPAVHFLQEKAKREKATKATLVENQTDLSSTEVYDLTDLYTRGPMVYFYVDPNIDDPQMSGWKKLVARGFAYVSNRDEQQIEVAITPLGVQWLNNWTYNKSAKTILAEKLQEKGAKDLTLGQQLGNTLSRYGIITDDMIRRWGGVDLDQDSIDWLYTLLNGPQTAPATGADIGTMIGANFLNHDYSTGTYTLTVRGRAFVDELLGN